MQFVRAPDENVYIPPFNLIEIALSLCLEWWMDRRMYKRVNKVVMGVIYSPLLLVAAFAEQKTARDIQRNRSRGEEDDDVVEEWEQLAGEVDFEGDGWNKKCAAAKSNVEEGLAVQAVKKLRVEMEELKMMISELSCRVGSDQAGPGLVDGQGDELRRRKENKSQKMRSEDLGMVDSDDEDLCGC